MRKIILLFALLLGTYAFAQCPNDNVPFGTTVPVCGVGLQTATTCIFGGEYRSFPVDAGNYYTFETCGDTDFDTQISVYGAGGNLLAYNDDYCGLQSHVSFQATVTETIRVNVDKFYCTSETSCMTLNYSCQIGELPDISCPPNVMADSEPGVCGAAVSFSDAVAIDAEDGAIPTTQTLGDPSGSVFPVGVSTIEFSATDSDGNTVTCQFTITVNDIEDPVAVCQDITLELDAMGMATIVPADIDGGSTDNCGAPTLDFGGGSVIPGSLTSLFAAGNGGSFGGAVYFDVTVGPTNLDITAFDINTADAGAFTVDVYTLVGSSVGNEANAAAWGAAVATGSGTAAGLDNPSNAVLNTAISLSASTTYGIALVLDGSHGHDYTNGDGTNENYSNADISIALGAASNIPFTGSIFSPRIFNGTIYYETVVASTFGAFDCSMVGENLVPLLVSDASGNTDTCMATVTVEDNQAPVVICVGSGGTITEGETFEAATIPAGWTTEIVSGSHDWTFGSGAMPIGDPFPTNAAIFDDDAAGPGTANHARLISPAIDLSASAAASVSFDYSLQDFAGSGKLTVEVWDGAAWQEIFLADGADIPPTNSGVIDVIAYANAAAQLRFSYDDEDGGWNWGAGVDNLVVMYEMPPTPPLEVVLDPTGHASVDLNDLLFSVDDNCGYTVALGTGGGGGTQTITQNNDQTIVDGLGLTCQSGGITTDNQLAGVFDLTNDFGITGAWAISEVQFGVDEVLSAPGDEYPVAVNIYTTDSGDPNGNLTLIGSETFNLSSTDELSVVSVPFATAAVAPDGAVLVVEIATLNDGITSFRLGASDVAANDDSWILAADCGATTFTTYASLGFADRWMVLNVVGGPPATRATVDFDCSNLGENMVDVVVTDAGGNEASCTATVIVLDETAPVIACGPDPLVYGANSVSDSPALAIPDANPAGVTTTVEVTEDFVLTDVNIPVNITHTWRGDLDISVTSPAGTTVILKTADISDSADDVIVTYDDEGTAGVEALSAFDGESSLGTWTLFVADQFGGDTGTINSWGVEYEYSYPNPETELFIELGPDGTVTIEAEDITSELEDACGIDVVLIDITEFSCDDIGAPILVTIFVNDTSGNFASCQVEVNIVDTMAPTLVCPDPGMYGTEPSNNDGVYIVRDYYDIGAATYSDNCTEAGSLIVTQTPAPGTAWGINGTGNPGPYEVVFTVEDEYGNISTCTLEVTVTNGIGVTENTLLANALALYPNPASDQVTLVNTSDIALQTAMIYDLNGKLVADIDLSNMQNETSFDVSDFASGVYMVKIVGENANTVKRLVKK